MANFAFSSCENLSLQFVGQPARPISYPCDGMNLLNSLAVSITTSLDIVWPVSLGSVMGRLCKWPVFSPLCSRWRSTWI